MIPFCEMLSEFDITYCRIVSSGVHTIISTILLRHQSCLWHPQKLYFYKIYRPAVAYQSLVKSSLSTKTRQFRILHQDFREPRAININFLYNGEKCSQRRTSAISRLRWSTENISSLFCRRSCCKACKLIPELLSRRNYVLSWLYFRIIAGFGYRWFNQIIRFV